MKHRTPQEEFWAGAFGDNYVERNSDRGLVEKKRALLARIVPRMNGVESVLELGANVGLNLLALKALLPTAELSAVEINPKAYERLRQIDGVKAHLASILDYTAKDDFDLVLISGVLIHMNPDFVPQVYETLYRATRRYVLLIEYYNPVPIEVPYRGHSGYLFKRDWAGEMMMRFSDLRLIDYGFVYRRDPKFPGDDDTWFLLEKSQNKQDRPLANA